MKTPLSERFVFRARKAFTMMEVMTAMAIIAVVSSIVLPGAANFYSSERIKAVAEVVVQNIRMTKYRAMQEQALHRMIFSPGGDTYKIQMYSGFIEGSGVPQPDLVADLAEENYDSIKWESVLDTEEV
ncbi:MAG TPA: prepilin-type N-terminal cleavage/methylation domain-containing protein, partial [Candidatus Rifleibacterium sp.]|nr:prepilin-type N-terminal cleavage/methylation domain-containing protein [Candidatus Rifleibacterium sp.]